VANGPEGALEAGTHRRQVRSVRLRTTAIPADTRRPTRLPPTPATRTPYRRRRFCSPSDHRPARDASVPRAVLGADHDHVEGCVGLCLLLAGRRRHPGVASDRCRLAQPFGSASPPSHPERTKALPGRRPCAADASAVRGRRGVHPGRVSRRPRGPGTMRSGLNRHGRREGVMSTPDLARLQFGMTPWSLPCRAELRRAWSGSGSEGCGRGDPAVRVALRVRAGGPYRELPPVIVPLFKDQRLRSGSEID
jgi:hypothetical protein